MVVVITTGRCAVVEMLTNEVEAHVIDLPSSRASA